MRMDRLKDIALPIVSSVYAINPHNIYLADPITGLCGVKRLM